MKVAGLFAGIGGLELGLSRAGHEAALLCEVWEPAVSVLESKFPSVPVHRDICSLKSLPQGTQLVAAGFPCQDLSQAGRTAGISGKNSGLVDQVFRLLDGSDVPLVLFENVPFMLRLDKGAAMRRLTSELEARGYRWAYRIINTLSFLPQRRERVFVLASRCDIDPAEVLLSDDAQPPAMQTDFNTKAHGFYWTEGVRGLGWAVDAIPPLKNGSTVGIPSPPAIVLPGGSIIKPEIRDAERLQGFDARWTEPAEKEHRPSLRWSLVGNAVSVPVAEWVGKRLASPRQRPHAQERALDLSSGWPKAAKFDGKRHSQVEIGQFPIWCDRSPLSEFLQFEGSPLSVRATSGFYERTQRSSLRFPDGFIDLVRKHLLEAQGNSVAA